MKIWAYIALLTILVGTAYKSLAFSYSKGVADTELAYTGALQELKDESAIQAVKDYREAQEIAGATIDKEILIVTEIREIEREVQVIVERIVEIKPECAVLPELGRLFSSQAAAANGASIRVTEDPG